MKFSKMICAVAVASLLMLQNVAPMVPVMADTTETTVETEATEETKHHEETAKTKETKGQTESSETSETTKASEKPVETTVSSETTEPSDETKPSGTTESKETTGPSESAVTAETTAPTEKTEPSETTVPSETSESTTETTESSKPSETTSETTVVETTKIVKAKTADEYIKLVAALPDGDKLIVATKNDLSALKPDAGVYFDGIYTLWFKTGSEYETAVKYVASHHYGYTEDGVVGLCGLADYSAYARRAVATDPSSSSGKTRIVIIDTGVNGADEAYSVIGSDEWSRYFHGRADQGINEQGLYHFCKGCW